MPDNLGRCLQNLNSRPASEVTGSLAHSMFHVYQFEKSKQQTSQIPHLTQQSQVYVGVDVFGRGCLGGGGFDTRVAVTKYSNDTFLKHISTLLKGESSTGLWIVSGSLCPRLDLGVR